MRDAATLEELYCRHSAMVHAIVNQRVRNVSDADDITQGIFLKLANKPRSIPAEDAMRWLARVAVNAAIDALRARRHPWLPLTHIVLQLSSAEVTYINQAENERMHVALAALAPSQRTALRLSYFDGLTHAQIAWVTRVPLGTVTSRIRSGVRQLRAALSEPTRLSRAV